MLLFVFMHAFKLDGRKTVRQFVDVPAFARTAGVCEGFAEVGHAAEELEEDSFDLDARTFCCLKPLRTSLCSRPAAACPLFTSLLPIRTSSC